MTELERGRPRRAPSRVRPWSGAARRLLAIAIAVIAAGSLAGTLGVSPVNAATDQLRESVFATYRVDPAEGRRPRDAGHHA